ncbi:MAG TPA: class I SAM-dependent rRNA methyltransferase [Dissulfurispiraceae bacterium]
MEKVLLKRTSRIRAGHLWIFSNELATSPKKFAPGSLVEVYDHRNEFMGIGYINPNSLISVRLLTREREEIDGEFFRGKIIAALEYRKRFLPGTDSCRLIYSEGDFLPGLIVDKYDGCLVVQISTLGMEQQKDLIVKLLDELLSPALIVLKNDSRSRTLEGLPLEKMIIKGALDTLPVVKDGDVLMEIDPLSGQKSGFFLDQRENRAAFRGIADGSRALDLFCYSGAWGMQLAKKGMQVTFVDDSGAAIAQARRNADLNGLAERCEFVKADAFAFLKSAAGSGLAYDAVVLDPPAFVKSKAKIKEALRGYREINALAMGIVKRGGVLASSSCSYHVDRPAFLEMLHDAARDSQRNPRIIEQRSQGRDHPVLLSIPETEYLKCVFLEV